MSAVTWAEIERTRAPRQAPGRARHLQLVAPPAEVARPQGLVLTRRGRLVLTTIALVLVVATAFGLFSSPTSAAIPTTGPVVTVAAGQTLSEIAAHELPSLPIADGVAALQIANNLSTTDISAGQQLVIPQL